MTRTGFLRGAAAGGAAVATGGAAAWLAAPAAAAPTEQDLAWVRFAITAEAVSVAYYARARTVGGWTTDERRTLERATAAQVVHRNAFRTALVDLKEPVIDPADIEIELPDDGFTSRAAAIRPAVGLARDMGTPPSVMAGTPRARRRRWRCRGRTGTGRSARAPAAR